MISRIEQGVRRLRKKLSRSEWAVKLLGLSEAEGTATLPGVILLQVDGLAHTQLRRAMKNGRAPFLKDLMERQGYDLRPLYSGMPSTTPAVQAELFYGRKGAVPAFSYIHRRTGRRFVLYEHGAADRVARSAAASGKPLLAEGASYSNIFTGGAGEARYCIETLNLKSFVRSAHPFKALLILLLHVGKLFRVLGLVGLELGLAVWDFFQGLYERKNLLRELKFIPTRVGVSIVLRELIRFRVKMDVARGLPIVHANLLGYDEQSHRRGPSSAFAHWSLKGIDGTIKDIYRTARRSDRRDYQVVIYSDHGQEATESYQTRYGRRVADAVHEALATGSLSAVPMNATRPEDGHEYLYRRGKSHIQRGEEAPQPPPLTDEELRRIRVTDMGPLGHIYLPLATTGEEKAAMARRLVSEAGIPLVLYSSRDEVKAVNEKGDFDLFSRRERVLGPGHPFLTEVTRDLAALCRHPDAGDLVISGWSPDRPPISFAVENGGHGGPGIEESRGFLLLPPGLSSGAPWVRAIDLRKIVIDLLDCRLPGAIPCPPRKDPAEPEFRAMTYNIHSCMNMDGKIFPERIARVIRQCRPDVVALQEVDVNKHRTGGQDQAALLAESLAMAYRFFPVVEDGDGAYGLALLSRYPISDVRRGWLPAFPDNRRREPRGVLQATVEVPGGPVHILTTHLSLYPKERRAQMAALAGPEWLGGLDPETPVLVCGDFNAGPRSPVYRLISHHLTDVQNGNRPAASTFFSRNPLFRIDHIFVSSQLAARSVAVPRHHEAQLASDHLPIYADLVVGESFSG